MIAVSPVMPGSRDIEIVLGKDQPEYTPLPCVHLDNTISQPMITRWRLTEAEVRQIVLGADIILTQLTFQHRFQPVSLQVCGRDEMPDLSHCEV